ncbi:MAG: hypothetical protein LBG75_00475 [Candidatus Nomurabacteria bacterium]|jgi:repressor LexA|nr:hypothetical protein [Candidatus Nomurabacteria bacterium]
MVLTKKQQAVLDFIKQFLAERGYSPSYREVCAGLEVKSISTVAEHIDNLVAKGYLAKKDGSARSLEPVEQPRAVPAAPKESEAFQQKIAELEAGLPETAADIETLKKAAELLGINLS